MKKTIKIDGNRTLEFTGNVEIRDLEDFLEEIKDLKFTHINISYDKGYGEVDFTPYYNRFETDAEYELRMSRDKYFDETVRLNELKELERLKEKYEK